MKASKAQDSEVATLDCRTNQGIARVFSNMMTVKTNERTELVNLSEEIRKFVAATGVQDGYVQISSMHTTAGLFINEWQDALLADVKALIERVVPKETYYKHNDPALSDCDRHNADSHLRNVIIGQSLSIPICKAEVVLGRWQSAIMAEFDGPNERTVFMQVFGV